MNAPSRDRRTADRRTGDRDQDRKVVATLRELVFQAADSRVVAGLRAQC